MALHPAKVKVLSCGRRWGKTVLGGVVVMSVLVSGGTVAWITPTFKNSRPLWRWALQIAAPAVRAGKMTISRSERTIETHNGGLLTLYSGDNIDAIRGESFHCVVLDEAARLSEEAWLDAIMPTLADENGDAILISTPKGKNWFWQEWLRGQDRSDTIASWQAPTSANPNPNIRRAFALARERVPERTFHQEWLAEFIEGGEVFRRILDCATSQAQETPVEGRSYIFGVDWGRTDDFTVVTVLDATTRSMVYLDRFNRIDYQMQLGRLLALVERYRPAAVLAESNSMGQPLIEQLYAAGVPVMPFTTTAASKQIAIDGLALAFERGDISILPDATLIAELQAFEAQRLPSGMMRYSAPSGMHDDCVMSLAIAWSGVADAGSVFL